MKCLAWGLVIGEAFVLALGGWAAATAHAATKAERNRAAAQMVHDALRHELGGADSGREQLLDAALEQVPDYAPARWHRGYVRWNHQWLKYDELPELARRDLRLTAYRRERAKHEDAVGDHLAMARWCAERKLDDQRRAHLTRVLQLDPNHDGARRMLGYQRVGGTWLSPQEFEQAAAQAERAAASLREWRPKLEKICEGLTHRSQQARKVAKERLLAIDDPAAIPAMESILGSGSETIVLAMVEALAGMNSTEASVALARQAVFAPSEGVRQATAEQLKSRPVETYAPILLASLTTPIQTRAEVYQAPSGRLWFRQVLSTEGQDRTRVAVLETEYRGSHCTIRRPIDLRKPIVRIVEGDAKLRNKFVGAAVERQNASIDETNQRVCGVLATATGHDLAEPEAWWDWWNELNESFPADEKPVDGSYRKDDVSIQQSSPTPSTQECLVAGTLIWTALGPTAVERIQVGDQVLAQDPTTGELAYKPVLRTTVRSPARLVKLRLDNDTIHCSGGHPFWTCGQGWGKARDLRPGMQLHTVTGTTEVREVAAEGFLPTYNLIVADFHSYFVGREMVLSHDNTIRKPTDTLVPGLGKED